MKCQQLQARTDTFKSGDITIRENGTAIILSGKSIYLMSRSDHQLFINLDKELWAEGCLVSRMETAFRKSSQAKDSR